MTAPAPGCYRHADRPTWVRCTRCERPVCPDCMREAAVGFQCPDCVRAGSRGQRSARTAFGGRPGHTPDVTYALILLNVVVFAVTTLGGTGVGVEGGLSPLYRDFALSPLAVAFGDEWWRLGTAMFLHFGLVHILFNMLALYSLGPTLEQMLGRTRFLALYLVAGVCGNALSYAFNDVRILAAGASGAIFGLFGGYFVIARRMRADTSSIVGLIGVNFLIGVLIPNIDWRGHLGGLLGGLLVGAAMAYAPRGPQRTLVQVSGTLLVLLLAAGLVAVRSAQLT